MFIVLASSETVGSSCMNKMAVWKDSAREVLLEDRLMASARGTSSWCGCESFCRFPNGVRDPWFGLGNTGEAKDVEKYESRCWSREEVVIMLLRQ